MRICGTKTSTTKPNNSGSPKRTSQKIGKTNIWCEPRTISTTPANYGTNRKYIRVTSKSWSRRSPPNSVNHTFRTKGKMILSTNTLEWKTQNRLSHPRITTPPNLTFSRKRPLKTWKNYKNREYAIKKSWKTTGKNKWRIKNRTKICFRLGNKMKWYLLVATMPKKTLSLWWKNREIGIDSN